MEMKTFNKSNDADGKGDTTKPEHTANEMEGMAPSVVAPTDASAPSLPVVAFPPEPVVTPPTSPVPSPVPQAVEGAVSAQATGATVPAPQAANNPVPSTDIANAPSSI